jgi:endonuclease/exonuclease/phosphatase (EEP) superfamily protein YafD
MRPESGRFGRAVDALLGGLTLGLLGATALGLFARAHWLCELFAHFAVQGLAAAVVLAVLWFVRRRPGRALACGIAAVPHGLALGAWGVAPPTSVPEGLPRVRVASANLLTSNTAHAAFLAWVRAERPDVVVALEVGRDWALALETLQDLYPRRVFAAREDNFGVAALASNPAAELEAFVCGPADVPSLRIRVPVAAAGPGDGATITVVGTHPIPPISAARAAERDAQIGACADALLQAPSPRILAGDLNATPWAPVLVDLRARTGLRDSRAGFGLQASWPSGWAILGIPIDHLLHDADLAVIDRRVGPDIGSDHRPVVADFAVLPGTP